MIRAAILLATLIAPVAVSAQTVAPTYTTATGNTLNAQGVIVLNADGSSSITPAVGSLVNAVVGKASAGSLYGGEITTAATAGYLYVFNATSAPADGAVVAGTGSGQYQLCRPVAVTTSLAFTIEPPEAYANGIVAVFSSTACGTLTKNATAVFLKVRVK